MKIGLQKRQWMKNGRFMQRFIYYFAQELCSKLAASYYGFAGVPLNNFVFFGFGPFSAGNPSSEAARVDFFSGTLF